MINKSKNMLHSGVYKIPHQYLYHYPRSIFFSILKQLKIHSIYRWTCNHFVRVYYNLITIYCGIILKNNHTLIDELLRLNRLTRSN